ncbi:MAG: peptidase S8, partial [Bacteroidetes bacterium]|nr:peptidase S8 [Bacteroidota bacterium]
MIKFVLAGGVLLALLTPATVSFAQGTSAKGVPKGWHLMDKEKDGYSGISLDKAYEFVKTKNLKSKTVIVA